MKNTDEIKQIIEQHRERWGQAAEEVAGLNPRLFFVDGVTPFLEAFEIVFEQMCEAIQTACEQDKDGEG